MSDEQEVVKEVDRFWGKLFNTNWKVTLGKKKETIGKGMTSEEQIFSQQDIIVQTNKQNER